MKININKKEKVIIIIYLLFILILGLGITYSFLLLSARSKEDSNKVYAGSLDIDYVKGSEVIATTLYPIDEPTIDVTKDVYKTNFIVSSKGTLEQNVAINFQVAKNTFSNNAIKYVLYDKKGTKLAIGYLNQGMVNLIDNLYFEPVEEREFILIIWLQETPLDQSAEQGSALSGRIVIESKQYGY